LFASLSRSSRRPAVSTKLTLTTNGRNSPKHAAELVSHGRAAHQTYRWTLSTLTKFRARDALGDLDKSSRIDAAQGRRPSHQDQCGCAQGRQEDELADSSPGRMPRVRI